ncbi:MAG: hypothetical protein QOH51_2697 [Acidobacteriota bacterium]|nr:hypothetical protein [Acidobacteriota bacterium]
MRSLIFKIALVVACATACHSSQATHQGRASSERTNAAKHADSSKAGTLPSATVSPVLLATLEDRTITESSGVVASRRNPGLFWTHNDSGDGPFVYAFDRAGRRRGTWHVEGASARDWEDIAAGPGPEPGLTYLYAGDIGDNEGKREYVVVYRFPEPEVGTEDASTKSESPHATAPAEAIRLKYPDGPHDAEALLVHPTSGDLYIVSKTPNGAGVYKLAAPFNAEGVKTLERIAVLRGPDFFGTLVTGGDISPDGRRLVLCDYAQGYELTLPEGSKNFDDVWQQTPVVVPLGARRQGESVCYRLDGAALLATSEGTPTPLIEVVLPLKR